MRGGKKRGKGYFSSPHEFTLSMAIVVLVVQTVCGHPLNFFDVDPAAWTTWWEPVDIFER